MARESALTKIQKDSIQIEKFIFHLIVKDDDEPIFLDEVLLNDAQKTFFQERIAAVAEGTQYTFNSKKYNALAILCNSLHNEEVFVENSKTITNSFKSLHKGSMSDGAFVISTFKMLDKDDSTISLIALIKMDHKKVLEYKYSDDKENRQVQLREIANSFIESKEAVQKVAIIDIANEFEWDVLATERGKAEGITDYFKEFLNAIERDTPSKLTRKTVQEVSAWARINSDKIKQIEELKEHADISSYIKNRAIKFLQANDGVSFNSDNFYTHVLFRDDFNSESKSKINDLKGSLKDHFIDQGIDGQVFVSRPNSITKTVSRTKKKTEEGVIIEWQGDAADNNIEIQNANNQQIITITTSHIETIEK